MDDNILKLKNKISVLIDRRENHLVPPSAGAEEEIKKNQSQKKKIDRYFIAGFMCCFIGLATGIVMMKNPGIFFTSVFFSLTGMWLSCKVDNFFSKEQKRLSLNFEGFSEKDHTHFKKTLLECSYIWPENTSLREFFIQDDHLYRLEYMKELQDLCQELTKAQKDQDIAMIAPKNTHFSEDRILVISPPSAETLEVKSSDLLTSKKSGS